MIRLSKSVMGPAEKAAVLGVLDREYLGMGAEVQKLEEKLSQFFGRPAVCVNTGTAALHLALQACGVGLGDEVLVPSLTYVASFQAIAASGARPVACDVDPHRFMLDLRDAEKRITPRTKALMPVHYTGSVGDLAEVDAFARRHNLRVVEDAAHAFGSYAQGKRVGSFGDIACFSFDGIKNITCGEGGCIVSSDETVLQRARDARLLGVEKDTEQRYKGQRSWEFAVSAQGWRYHMSNIMAAIGLAQLERFNEFAAKRQLLAQCYDKQLSSVSALQLMPNNYAEVVPHIYVVRIKGLRERAHLQAYFLEQGIQTGVHYQPNHQLQYFAPQASLPVVEAIAPELISLPLHPDLTEQDVGFVCEHLISYVQRYS